MRAWSILVTLIACGGRSELDEPPLCQPGDPPVMISPEIAIESYMVNAITIDHDRVYVAQAAPPLLWSITSQGDQRTVLIDNVGAPSEYNGQMPLLVRDGVVFLDSPMPMFPLSRMPSTGGILTTVTNQFVSAFDWSKPIAYAYKDLVTGVDAISLEDGSSRSIASFPQNADVTFVGVTRRFLHALFFLGYGPQSQPIYTDHRIELSTGIEHDAVTLPSALTVTGPNAVCAGGTNPSDVICLRDGDAQATVLASDATEARVLRVDEDWVYVFVWRSLVRYALTDGRKELLANGATFAVASDGACIYAAMSTDANSTAIWRLSPPN